MRRISRRLDHVFPLPLAAAAEDVLLHALDGVGSEMIDRDRRAGRKCEAHPGLLAVLAEPRHHGLLDAGTLHRWRRLLPRLDIAHSLLLALFVFHLALPGRHLALLVLLLGLAARGLGRATFTGHGLRSRRAREGGPSRVVFQAAAPEAGL